MEIYTLEQGIEVAEQSRAEQSRAEQSRAEQRYEENRRGGVKWGEGGKS